MNFFQKEIPAITNLGGVLACGPYSGRRAIYLAAWPSSVNVAPNFEVIGDLVVSKGGTVLATIPINFRCQYDGVTGLVGFFRRSLARPPGFLSPVRAFCQYHLPDSSAADPDSLVWMPPNARLDQMLVISPHYSDHDFDKLEIVNKPDGLSLVATNDMGTVLLAVKNI